MGVDHSTLLSWLADYDKDNITIGVVASHSSLQILHGARMEGFRTLGIAVGENRRRFYKAFPGAEPDEWLMLEDYREMLDYAEWFREKNVIIVPHGSLVEYLGSENFRNLEVPTFGNRGILRWESSRAKQRDWLVAGGCTMPKVLEDPHDIDGPVIVKYAGAKGGRGYFIARDYRDFRRNVDIEEEFTIQEYVLGCRYYLHFFFDPSSNRRLPSPRSWQICWKEPWTPGTAFHGPKRRGECGRVLQIGFAPGPSRSRYGTILCRHW